MGTRTTHHSRDFIAKDARQFEEVFAGGRTGDPDRKTIRRIVSRQKSRRKTQRKSALFN